ncbi:MAG: hypothetical protein ACNYPG_03960 [Candidatus Porifericomitaceae bacterium WSBS_2022_MAG_OTU9]
MLAIMGYDDEDKTIQAGSVGAGISPAGGGAVPPPDEPPNVLLLVGFLLLMGFFVWLWRSGLVDQYVGDDVPELAASEDGTVPVPVSGAEADAVSESLQQDDSRQDANEYVDSLRQEAKDTEVDVRTADDFIDADSIIRIKEEGLGCTAYARDALESELGLPLDAEVKLWTEHEQVVYRTVAELLQAAAAEGSGTMLPLWRDGKVQATGARQLRSAYVGRMQEKLAVMANVLEAQVVTVGDIVRGSVGAGETVCLTTDINPDTVTLRQLMPGGVASDDLYYVYTVTESDIQGLWGIIHYGIIENFAKGIALRQGQDVNTYQVDIPYAADEQISETESSYLGRIISAKAKESFVYNHKKNRMGLNPDLLRPGQEIAVIRFTQAEMVAIYRHFAEGGNQ